MSQPQGAAGVGNEREVARAEMASAYEAADGARLQDLARDWERRFGASWESEYYSAAALRLRGRDRDAAGAVIRSITAYSAGRGRFLESLLTRLRVLFGGSGNGRREAPKSVSTVAPEAGGRAVSKPVPHPVQPRGAVQSSGLSPRTRGPAWISDSIPIPLRASIEMRVLRERPPTDGPVRFRYLDHDITATWIGDDVQIASVLFFDK